MTPAQSAAMSDHLVRVAHLKALQKANDWNDSELARRCGRQPQQVHAWYADKRRIGERLARSLEDQLGLRRYALDDRSPIISAGDTAPKSGVVNPYGASATLTAKEAPIIKWADIAVMLDAENTSLKAKSVHLETYAPASPRAKFLQVPDDSMAPEFLPGDHVLMDPAEAPHAGDVVLVRLPSNEHFLRYFKPRTPYVFDAVPGNENYLALRSSDDSAVVVAVMVEHRRYRRRR